MLHVVNKYKHTPTDQDIYIGRGSPLGNPFSHLPSSKACYRVETRDEAVDKYKEWLENAYRNDVLVQRFIDEMVNYEFLGIDLNLVCFCSPKRCHGDVIRSFVMDRVNRIKEYERR